jgi:hypothetical protein
MNAENVALCALLRKPVGKRKPLSYSEIAKLVKKVDGTRPTKQGVWNAVQSMNEAKAKPGRRKGWRKTSKREDSNILQTFKRLRPDGHGVDSRIIHTNLPRQLRRKVCRRTVRRRLAEKDFVPRKKIANTDTGPKHRTARIAFANRFASRTSGQWKTHLQAVGDLKEFTFYPKELKPKHIRLRASWTYMKDSERLKPAFVRPKKWFSRDEWKKTKKFRVLSFTNSEGGICAVGVTEPWNSPEFVKLVRNDVGPWLRSSFPDHEDITILIDSEKVMHTPEAKAALKKFGISSLESWPKHSPDLNPQENLWALAEVQLRKSERAGDSFDVFKKRVLQACKSYTGAEKLIPSMATRIKAVLDSGGAMLKY